MKLIRFFVVGLLATVFNVQVNALPVSLPQQFSQPTTQTTAPTDVAATTQISRNWSGYAALSGTYTGVSASWTIPKNSGNDYGIDDERRFPKRFR